MDTRFRGYNDFLRGPQYFKAEMRREQRQHLFAGKVKLTSGYAALYSQCLTEGE
jgi:hypothetical protein